MEWGALAHTIGSTAGCTVDFADDDSVPARDLNTGERLEPASTVGAVPGMRGLRLPDRSPEVTARRGAPELTARRGAPVVLARERRLEVAGPLATILPGGLRRGSTVGVRGSAGASLALALSAGPMASGSWLAVIGGSDLCLAGAEQLGVVLHRTVLVDEPPPGAWGSVVAALVDAFDLVVLDGRARLGAAEARRLSARVRERGSVLIDIGGVWPEGHDTVLEVVRQRWSGLGDGHGVLTGRSLTVTASGRRGATRPRTMELWLPGAPASIMAFSAGPDTAPYAGADIDALIDATSTGADQGADIVPLRQVG